MNAIVCINSGITLVDTDGNVLVDCVRAGRGWNTGVQEEWIRLDKFDTSCDSLDHWDSITRFKAGTQLPLFMQY